MHSEFKTVDMPCNYRYNTL